MALMVTEGTSKGSRLRTRSSTTSPVAPRQPKGTTVARPASEFGRTSSKVDAESYRVLLTGTGSGRRLDQPVPLIVRRTAAYVAVAEPESGIYGAGATLDEALHDFWAAVRDYRDVLSSHDSLSPNMSKLLAFVASLTA